MTALKAVLDQEISLLLWSFFPLPKGQACGEPAGFFLKVKMAAGVAEGRESMPGPLSDDRLAGQDRATSKAGFRTTVSWWPYLEGFLPSVLHSDVPRLPSEIAQLSGTPSAWRQPPWAQYSGPPSS